MLRRLFRNGEPTAWFGRSAVLWIALLASACIFSACGQSGSQAVRADDAQPGAEADRQPAAIQIPAGTPLSVRLLSPISSSSASSGEEIEAELAAPVVVDGRTVFYRSAHARLKVVAVEESGRLQRPGFLEITLDAVQDPGGNWDRVSTTSVPAKGGSHEKRNAALIGGAAAVGATIGAIAGGGKGAAIGAVSGAGAGTAGAYATGRKDVTFSAERVLRFRTTGATTINR